MSWFEMLVVFWRSILDCMIDDVFSRMERCTYLTIDIVDAQSSVHVFKC